MEFFDTKPYVGKITEVLISDEIFNKSINLTNEDFINMTIGLSGPIRMGKCPECKNLSVYINGKPTHRTDFEKIRCLMES